VGRQSSRKWNEKNREYRRKFRRERGGFPDQPGYVYAVTHPAFPGYVKVGRAVDPRKRLQGYNTSCPRNQFSLAFTIHYENHKLAEIAIHDRLRGLRGDATGEWFKAHPDDIFQIIKETVHVE
jgi:hypothetical protein